MIKKLVTWYKGFSSFQFGQRCCHFFSRRGYGADNTNKLPSAKVATEARPRYQLRMVSFTYLTCIKKIIKRQ